MSENMRNIKNPSNMPTQKQRFVDTEWYLNDKIQALKNDLEKDIDDINTTLTSIEERLRKVEISTAESRGRKSAFSSLKGWIVPICAVAALILSIINFLKKIPL